MNKKIKKEIVNQAKKYSDEEYNIFEAEMGWEDWMFEFCEDFETEDGEDEMISEQDSARINSFLQECWDEVHEEVV